MRWLFDVRAGRWSFFAVVAILLVFISFYWVHTFWNVLSWDAFAYYLYLPATFLHHDPALQDQSWVRHSMEVYNTSGGGSLYQAIPLENGRWVIKVSMGVAMLWSPFFLLGHVWAWITGAPMDGFSLPYQLAVVLGVFCYLCIGWLVLRRVLLRFFDDRRTAIALVLVGLGTNYLHQMLFGITMPHVLLFNLYAVLLWNTLRWHEDHATKHAMGIAVCAGLLTLARPSEVVCVLIPLCWAMPLRWPLPWKERWRLWASRRGQVLLMAAVLLLLALPQLIYWRTVTGHWVYMSYSSSEEGFDFAQAHIGNVLFSFRKGWYIYTPIMALATMGLLALRRSVPQAVVAVTVFLLLNLYIVSSWSCWWYAQSFGQRALVESYAVMSLPLAAFARWAGQGSVLRRSGCAALLSVFLVLNVFQTWQASANVIDGSRMTAEAYGAAFGQVERPAEMERLLLPDRMKAEPAKDYERSDHHIIIHHVVNADQEWWGVLCDTLWWKDVKAMRFDGPDEYSPPFRRPFRMVTDKDHVRLNVRLHTFILDPAKVPKGSIVCQMSHNGVAYGYTSLNLNELVLHAGWNAVEMDYLTPEVRNVGDQLSVYYWHRSSDVAYIGDLELTVLEKNDR